MSTVFFADKQTGIFTQCVQYVLLEFEDRTEYNEMIAVILDEIPENVLGKKYLAKDSKVKELPEKPSQFYLWNLETESWVYSEELHNQYLDKLKVEALRRRNGLLLNSDWTELPSALQRLGEAKVTEWQTYRQALRDITKQSGYPENIIWPEQPA